MFGVLIVDDEMIVRYGIRSMVDWEKIGFTVIGDAANGKEALELFHRYKPEVVITDIKMPIMDGIELITNIRAANWETKIIILSCYEDFSFAREAVRLGVTEYLIKSDLMPADFLKLLLKLKDSLMQEQKKRANLVEIQGKMLETEAIIKEKFLWDLSLGVITKSERFNDTLEQLGINYFNQKLIVLVGGIDYFEKVTIDYSETQKKELLQSFEPVIQAVITSNPNSKGEIYPGNSGEFNLILTSLSAEDSKNFESVAISIAEKIVGNIQAQFGHSITIGVSNCFEDLGNLKQAYFEALHAYKYKRFFGCGRVVQYCDTLIREMGKKQAIRANTKELQDYVYFLKLEKVQLFLDDLFNKIESNQDYEEVNLIALELVLILSNIYGEICKDNEEVGRKKKEYYQQIKYLETVEDIRTWFKAAFIQLIDYIQVIYNQDSNVITKALYFINNNYHHDISLTEVSEHIHLSKNYFTNLFKKEVGESFVEYLTKLRIEKAKLLLQNSDLKTSDVGNAVGIFDSHYFSKVFKKNTGFSPTEYKSHFQKS